MRHTANDVRFFAKKRYHMTKYDLIPFIEQQNATIPTLREGVVLQVKELEKYAREFHETIDKAETPLKTAMLTNRHMGKLREISSPEAITPLSTIYSDMSMLREEIAASDIVAEEKLELYDMIDAVIKKALVLINVLNLINGIILPEYFTGLAKTLGDEIDSNIPTANTLSRGLILKLATLASQIPNNT